MMQAKHAAILHILRAAVILAAIVFICIGVFRNESAIVLRKAVRICLECIGVAG